MCSAALPTHALPPDEVRRPRGDRDVMRASRRSSKTSCLCCRRAVDLINHESSKVLPRDWLRKKEQIAVDVHAMNVMVVRAS